MRVRRGWSLLRYRVVVILTGAVAYYVGGIVFNVIRDR